MAVALVLAGLLAGALPAIGRPLGRRIAPSEWAQLSLVALVGAVALVQTGLVLMAAPAVLRSVGVDALASACDRLLGPLMPIGNTGGWIAAALAVLTPALAWRGWHRARRRLSTLEIEPYLGEHHACDDHDLVILPVAAQIAYSVDGVRPQVVVSRGLLAALTAAQAEVVIAHERAHLEHRHPRLLIIAAAARDALGWWPPMRPSHRVVRSSVERWADDHATGNDPTSRRCLSDALERVAALTAPTPVPAFSLAEATAERIDAMQDIPRSSWVLRTALYLPGALVAAVALGVLADWLSAARLVLAMAGTCPI